MLYLRHQLSYQAHLLFVRLYLYVFGEEESFVVALSFDFGQTVMGLGWKIIFGTVRFVACGVATIATSWLAASFRFGFLFSFER
jgi:hypothetical protein